MKQHNPKPLFQKYPWLREVLLTLTFVAIIFSVVTGGFFLLRLSTGTDIPLVVVSSGSMEPTINVGDVCLIQHVPQESIQVGDIIVFQASWLSESSPPVIHRVISITEVNGTYYFYTQGDNTLTNPIPDPKPTPGNQVYGVSVVTWPSIGLVILWLQNPTNFTILAGLLLMAFAISILLDYRPKSSED